MKSLARVQMIGVTGAHPVEVNKPMEVTKRTLCSDDRLRILREAPRDCWIAIVEEQSRIVASGPEFSDVVDEAERLGFSDPLMIRTARVWAPTCFMRVPA
jgi:hypothetical protein